MITSPEDPQRIEIPYRWAGVDGIAHVEMAVNTDPAALGCPEFARGFPFCTATLESEGRGYDHHFGWMQFVDESSNPGFCIDQHPAFASPLPFLCEGQLPQYFDAPHTDDPDWDFLVHTFLCGKGGELHEFRKEARAIFGFKWGFSKQGRQIEWFGPDPLSAQDWDSHREYLVQTYDTQIEEKDHKWFFKPGFSQHPLEP